MIEVVEYIDRTGRIPYRDWLRKLDVVARSRILASILRMESGNFAGTKSVGAGVSELRLNFGLGYRVYFGRDGADLVILLGGGAKRRQEADIETARNLWTEYKKRKREI